MNTNEKVAAKINLIKLPVNNEYEFEFDQSTDWVRDILLELNEEATDKKPEDYLKETSLIIDGSVVKKNNAEWGEYFIVRGHIQATYATECIRTLQPMTVDLDIPLKICFFDQSLATSELFEDQDETYVDQEVMEIYFYDKRTIDFQEMIHEQVFLHYEHYPALDADSPIPAN